MEALAKLAGLDPLAVRLAETSGPSPAVRQAAAEALGVPASSILLKPRRADRIPSEWERQKAALALRAAASARALDRELAPAAQAARARHERAKQLPGDEAGFGIVSHYVPMPYGAPVQKRKGKQKRNAVVDEARERMRGGVASAELEGRLAALHEAASTWNGASEESRDARRTR